VLEELRIHGLGVIAEAVLELSPGLTVVTGETGAGKTMVLHGLSLLCGGRADAGMVRAGSDAGNGRALVEGRWLVPADGDVAARAVEAGAELDGGALLAARSVAAEGRSRAHLGSRTVPVGLLAELSADLVAVHGQSDQQRLVRPGVQREALDRFGGPAVAEPLARYREVYARWSRAERLRAELTAAARERAREAEALREGLAEVAAVAPGAGEDADLVAEARRLDNADALRVAAETAHAALAGEPSESGPAADALTAVAAARRALEGSADDDPVLADLAGRVTEIGHLVADVAGDVASYASGVESDPARLAAIQGRRAAITALVRRLPLEAAAADAAGALAWSERAAERLLALDADDDRLAGLDEELTGLSGRLAELAGEVGAARRAAAARFEEAVSAELAGLAMPAARVVARVTARPAGGGLQILVDGEPRGAGPDGADEVELLLAPHPGAPQRPLSRGASGGELSRVMLAVEVVFAGADPVPTMVFDEVDAGVGGKAAVEVGRRLARLARDHQVVVVTHLPQVAAFADRHLVVTKSSSGEVTTSGVRALDDSGRATELSRMLAGLDGSDLALAHAEELLAVAAPDRAERVPVASRGGPDER
jgi:DNA repair protein RecN (Recombination protein N)